MVSRRRDLSKHTKKWLLSRDEIDNFNINQLFSIVAIRLIKVKNLLFLAFSLENESFKELWFLLLLNLWYLRKGNL